jgi:hypothetical protein
MLSEHAMMVADGALSDVVEPSDSADLLLLSFLVDRCVLLPIA